MSVCVCVTVHMRRSEDIRELVSWGSCFAWRIGELLSSVKKKKWTAGWIDTHRVQLRYKTRTQGPLLEIIEDMKWANGALTTHTTEVHEFKCPAPM